MPCSGLKSATSFTSCAVEQQVDRRRAVARAPGVVGDQADALALAAARSPAARRTSRPVMHRRRAAPAPAAVPDGAEVAARSSARAAPRPAARPRSPTPRRVATRARSGVTSPLPSGCTRFDRNTTNIPRRRIDPQRRAGEAGVAERAERQQLAAVRRVRRVDVPAEAADVRIAGAARRRRHLRDGQRRQDARAAGTRRRRAASGRRSPGPPPC